MGQRVAVAVTFVVVALMTAGCGERPHRIAPDVRGMSVNQATAALAAAELEPDESSLRHEHYDSPPVISTSPAPGARVYYPFKVALHLEEVTVASVADAGTVVLSTGDRIQLLGLDVPAPGECGAAEAVALLTEEAVGKTAAVHNPPEVADRNGSGDLVAYVAVDGINDLGFQLLWRGLAVPDGSSHPADYIYVPRAQETEPYSCEPKSPEVAAPSNPDVLPGPDPNWSGVDGARDDSAGAWSCVYSPTMNRDWHDDVLCTNGEQRDRPYLRPGDSFVTEDEMIRSAQDYEDQLNGG